MAKKKSRGGTPRRGLRLVVSNDPKPAVQLEPGMKLDVVAVSLVTPALKPAGALAARLCGGTSTCLALVSTRE